MGARSAASRAVARTREVETPVAAARPGRDDWLGVPAPEMVEARPTKWITLRTLEQAMARGDFQLHYQPKLHLRTRAVDSVEALARWTHPHHGGVSPVDFIPRLEAGRAIRPFTEWTLARAVEDQASLAAQGHHVAMSVNVSGQVVSDPDFAQAVLRITRARRGEIVLEITETAVIRDPVNALANLELLVAAGIRIAIDDYGTGLSSLAYLRRLPAQELKIDRLFISAMTESQRDPLLVRSTIDLAHGLGMTVTAEGVEKLATLELLRVMGCDHAQGYVVDRPMTLAVLGDLLRDPTRLGQLGREVSLFAPGDDGLW